ncbi:gliding motility-associated C-terminal domain-containing protein [Chitinophaga filiformis]|uniref:HYR-like domain-containing protein n=1 Tax=Chitinophaga filiformis TaxID=104663 RepID=UPI001F249497|nr:gliding motility-associated C-terminal domain-containing protein [Chitinophaga filiformis]MCF6405228.1 gliding motility-associated C-terminal domain-containing protein [Chitinophaga filiformis]
MKKLLILLCLSLCCAFGTLHAQTVYVNIPDTVCMSRTNATANQIKFTSVNAMVEGAGLAIPQKADWTITSPNNTEADYEILYTENPAATKAGKLTNSKALTLQFLVPGDYTFNIKLYYKGADSVLRTVTRTVKMYAADCTISTCGDGGATMAGFSENFGSMPDGVNRRNYPVDGVVLYNYQPTGDLNNDSYAITNSPSFARSEWVSTTSDHTGGYRGAMLVANSAVTPQQFYKKTVTGLCPGSVYNFSAWLMNVSSANAFNNTCRSGYQYAGVTFTVVDAANPARVLNSFRTYSVSMMLGIAGPTWQRYGGTFVVPSDVDEVTVYVTNNKPGGCGNDIAIDDIEFSYCSPSIVATIDGDGETLQEVLCEGAPITLSASYQPLGYFVDPVYQWQMSDDEGRTWINVPYGTGNAPNLVIGPGELKGTRKVASDYLFQVLIYERGSDSTTCSSPSSQIRLTILPMPTLNLTQSEVCSGTYVELEASGGFDYYTWKDLPGYTDTKRTIQVDKDTVITVYGYVEYADGHTCMDENSTQIKMVRSPRVDVAVSDASVCVGESINLKINDVLTGYTINWFRGPDASGNKIPMPEYDNMVEASQIQIVGLADTVFSVTVKDLANVCEATSAPVIIDVSATPSTKLKPNQNIYCASANPTGNFTVEVDKITGATGTWRVEDVYGPAVTDDVIDNYVKILLPSAERTRVTLKRPGTSVVLSWTVRSPANANCATTILDTLHLLVDPTYSNAGKDTTQCGTDNIFIMNASQPLADTVASGPAAEKGIWKLVSGNATIAYDTAYNTAVTALDNEGDIVLTWSITNAGGCIANIDTVVLHKIGKPVINLVTPVISCSSKGSFILDTLSTKGTPTLYSITPGTSPMPGFVNIIDQPLVWPLTVPYPATTAPGVYTFNLSYKTAKAGCDSTIPFTVNVSSAPTAPTGITASATNICGAGNTVTLTVNGGSLGLQSDKVTPNGVWAWYAGGCGTGTRLATGASVTLPLSATTTYYVRAESLGGCDTTVCVSRQVTFTPMPAAVSAGADQSNCNSTAFTMAASDPAPGTGAWSLPTGTTATITAGQVNSRTALINVPQGTSVTAIWTVTNGTCVVKDTAVLTNFAPPTTANAGRDSIQCGNAQFVMKANAATIGTGTWSLSAGTTASITTGQENNPAATINVPAGVTVTATWTIRNGLCVSTDNVVLTNAIPPTTANAGLDQAKCGVNNFIMTALPVTVGTGKWILPAGTPASIPAAQINNPNAVISVPVGVSVVATWQTTNGTCTSTDNVTLTNSVMPATANAGPDISQCNNTVFTLSANAPGTGGGTGRWSVVSPATYVLPGAAVNNPNAVLSIPAGTVVVLRWTISNGGCSSSDDVTLSNSLAPNPAAAGPDEVHCNAPAFALTANSAAGGTGTWRVISPATFIFPSADINNPTANISVPAGTVLRLVWTIANGGCTTSDTVVLTNYALPDVANAGPDQSQCAGLDFKMAGNKPTVAGATGTWTVVSGTATIAAGQANMDTAHVTLPTGATAVLRWTMTNGTCSNFDEVTLTSIPKPTTANAGVDQQHCDNALFTMAANTPVTGTATWSLPAGSSASIAAGNFSNPAAVVTVPPGTSATIAWVISNSTCNSVDSITLVNSVMPNNATAGTDQVHCDDPNFTMNANTASPATAVGTWTIVGGATAVISDIHSPTARVTLQPGTTATLRWTIANGACTSTPDEVVLTNQPAIQGNTITADQVLCASDVPATLTGGAVSGGTGSFTYQWQMSTTNAITGFVNVTTGTGGTTDSYTPASISQNTWFRRVVMSGACTGNISNAVMLTLMSTPPVVVSVPAPITVDCVQGTDYTTKFGTPVFSHAPYNNEPITVTSADVTTTVDACTFRIERTWTATDRCGLSAQAQQVITVTDKTAPVFNVAAPANVTVNCDAIPAAVNLTATDACSGPLTVTPIEVQVSQPGACPSNYQLIRKWVAVDACGNASDTLKQIVTVRDITPPVFDGTAPANITVSCDQVPAGEPLTATDNCTPGTITVTPVDVRKTLSGSKCDGNYQIVRTWTATDLCGNKAVLTQTITVQDNVKPVFSITVPPVITVNCDSVPDVTAVTATDNCTATVKVKVSQRKEFLSSTCPSNYRLTRIWTAIDNCGNTATMQQVITVQDTAKPVFTSAAPADTTVDCNAVPEPPALLTATDNCGAVKVTYLQVRETINGACAGNYRLIRTWTAKDACSNTTIARQVITVADTTRPKIDPAPADVTISYDEQLPVPATLYAVDNCDVNFPKKVTMVQDPFVADKCAGYTVVRRWNISDACGNAAIERVQTITVSPAPKPELDPNLPANCSNNTKFAVLLKNKVSKPKFTLVSVVPATAVATPLTQSSNVFDLNGAVQASFAVTNGVTGCVSDTVTYDLQYIEKPVVELGQDVSVCAGESVTLDAGINNAGYTIRWSTGANTQTITVNTSGTYSVTVSNGVCSTTDEVKVTVNNPPLVNLPDTTICEGSSVKLNLYVPDATYVWSTGETTSSIEVYMAGTYGVDVTLNGCTTHDDVTVTVATAPNVVVSDDTQICPDETAILTVAPDGGNVRWNTGETTNEIVVSRPGDYWVTVTRGGCVVEDTVRVTLKSQLDIDIGPQRDICIGGSVVLNAEHADAVSYLWNDGDTNPVKEVNKPGKYIVSVMDRFCSQITMDSVNVTVAGIPEFDLGRDTTLCLEKTLVLNVNAGAGNSVRWQDGATTSTYTVTSTGYYTVVVYNDCGSVQDNIAVTYKPCEANPQFPTAFTPNGDGKNDVFKPTAEGPMYDYELRVFNRWGQQVCFIKDYRLGWDGRYLGNMVESGSYIWVINYKKKVGGPVSQVTGQITVIR